MADTTKLNITSTESVPDEAKIARINSDNGPKKQPYNTELKTNLQPTPAGRQFDRNGKETSAT